jgi:hypothetical protein
MEIYGGITVHVGAEFDPKMLTEHVVALCERAIGMLAGGRPAKRRMSGVMYPPCDDSGLVLPSHRVSDAAPDFRAARWEW